MASDNFIGTTLTFGEAVAKLLSVSASEDTGSVDLSASDSALKLTGGDIPSHEITCEVRGDADIHVGDTPSILTIAWTDGTSTGGGSSTWRVSRREKSGSQGSGLSTRLTFQRATA